MKEIQIWLSDKELETMFSSEYWNDNEVEKNKAFWILGGNYVSKHGL